MKTVKISIKKGQVTFDYDGFKGTECTKAHKSIQEILNKHMSINVTSQKDKEEMYITDDPLQTNKEYA